LRIDEGGMRRLMGGLILALGLAGPAAAAFPADPTPVDGKPGVLSWILRPDSMDLSLLAEDLGMPQGHATVECVLDAKRRPANCVVTAEQGYHMGRFVSRAAGRYKAASQDSIGGAVVGRRVRFAMWVGRPLVP
jgi:hypothetical protein